MVNVFNSEIASKIDTPVNITIPKTSNTHATIFAPTTSNSEAKRQANKGSNLKYFKFF